MNELIDHAKQKVRQARRVFVVTGAGISAESGVPTFRDPGGLWRNIDPMKVATPEGFAADPVGVWKWYDERRIQLSGLRPNPGHYALSQIENRLGDEFFLLTQNIDDLHERAGSLRAAHIHGKLYEIRCTREGTIREDRRVPLPEIPPRCKQCGALERPNVVWFGELIDQDAIQATERFLAGKPVDVTLVIGTEASFGYIIEWSLRARGQQGILIEINPGETQLTPYADLYLKGKSGEVLPLLVS